MNKIENLKFIFCGHLKGGLSFLLELSLLFSFKLWLSLRLGLPSTAYGWAVGVNLLLLLTLSPTIVIIAEFFADSMLIN